MNNVEFHRLALIAPLSHFLVPISRRKIFSFWLRCRTPGEPASQKKSIDSPSRNKHPLSSMPFTLIFLWLYSNINGQKIFFEMASWFDKKMKPGDRRVCDITVVNAEPVSVPQAVRLSLPRRKTAHSSQLLFDEWLVKASSALALSDFFIEALIV